ncbi:hypothetical protein QBC37DRAFT_381147, partial [Rhypophila decipiens]
MESGLPEYHGVHYEMLEWVMSTANAIIEEDRLPLFQFNGFPVTRPTTRELVNLCRVIASSRHPPSPCHSVWRARAEETGDPEIRRRNNSHEFYIDEGLMECRTILEGSRREDTLNKAPEGSDDGLRYHESIPMNRFEVLPLEEDCGDEEPESKSEEPEKVAPGTKGNEKENWSRFCTLVSNLSLMWSTARYLLQKEWLSLSHDEANSVAIAVLCNSAVKLVERASTALLEFSTGDGDSFEKIIEARTSDSSSDSSENWMVHCYDHLKTFIDDFQKAHNTGVTTKAMKKRLRDWNPYLDLATAKPEERIKWR